jgi:hypothetical protein
MKSLNDKELSAIELASLKEQLAKQELITCNLEIKVLDLQMKNVSLTMMQKKNDLENLRNAEANARMNRAETLKLIAKKKALKEGWGYNPDTGEIIEN